MRCRFTIVTVLLFLLSLLSGGVFLSASPAMQVPPSGPKPSSSDEDSLIWLLSAASAEVIEGSTYIRKVIGPAVFFHNNTYLNCDTAFWFVDREYIDAIGRVSIVQDNTVLTSDKMHYIIPQDLAQFRGGVVELKDKDGNLLRTNYLDYNTKDSVAVFRTGGSMKDKDGNIIESVSGDYDAKAKLFKFRGNVNMFTDSVFVRTSWLNYLSDIDKAEFGGGVYAWKDENMLTSREGWYDRSADLFFFQKNVHILTENQEGWSDSLYFNRLNSSGEMYGNVQITDEKNSVSAVSDKLEFTNSPRVVTLTRNPAVIMEMNEDNKLDTLYFGGDTLIYYSLRKCDVDSTTIALAQKRKEYMEVDAVNNLREKNSKEMEEKKAAEAAKQQHNRGGGAASTGKSNTGNKPAAMPPPPFYPSYASLPAKDTLPASMPDSLGGGTVPVQDSSVVDMSDVASADTSASVLNDTSAVAVGDTVGIAAIDTAGFSVGDTSAVALSDTSAVAFSDTSAVALSDTSAVAPGDTTGVAADSVAVAPPDTSTVTFIRALRNVKAYKSDLQAVCDSLEYSSLDSLARMFIKPIIWNEVKNQFSSDSIYISVAGERLSKVSFQSNAFIHTQEDTVHYNQIKSLEMMAFFNEDSELYRFDALGGTSAVFYLREEEEISLVNQIESKMLSASLVDGNVQRIHYYESPKNDIYPISQITIERQRLKGFAWQEERRPADRFVITDKELRPCQRERDEKIKQPEFRYTDEFFPGYIDGIKREIFVRDSLKAVAEARRKALEQMRLDSLERARLDSLEAVRLDSLATADSLKRVKDSLAAVLDSAEMSEILIDSLVNTLDSIDIFEEKDEFIDKLEEFTAEQRMGILSQLREDLDNTKKAIRQKGTDRTRKKELRLQKRELKRQIRIVRKSIR